jgi:type VI secretion system protein ImpE
MKAQELLRQGKLDECLAAVESDVRSKPADAKQRILLFQVLAVMGQWDRALTQLSVAAGMDASAGLMDKVCRQAILCERLRSEVWAGKRSPLVLGEPEPWVGWMIQALAMDAAGNTQGAADLRAKALEEAAAVAGTLNIGPKPDKTEPMPFEWIADADPRLGPILEAIVDGKYYWIPWHRIALVKIDPPADLRDVVWSPANFVWSAGGQSVGLIPTRYPGSEAVGMDPLVRLGRKTDFISTAAGEVPVGQRMLATDAGEFALLEVRSARLGEGELDPLGGAPEPGGASLSFDPSLKPGGGKNG